MKRYRKNCSGFTLVEVLVLIAVIAVLMGLLLSAVQKVREAATRLQCQNNLKQLGLASQNYHSSHGVLPMGITPIIARDSFRYSTWLTHLLPFIEQDPLWNETIHAYGVQPRNPFSDAHVGMRTVVKLFTCPSDSRLVRPHATHGQVYAALTSYQGVSGTAYLHADGVYYNDSLTKLTDITDGTSNTLAFGERPPSADFYYGWWYASGLYGKQGGTAVLGVRELRAPNFLFTPGCQEGPYSFSPGNISNQCDLFHFWSLHDGGANFAFSDGAVRFMRYAADSVMPALATRAGGDVVASLN